MFAINKVVVVIVVGVFAVVVVLFCVLVVIIASSVCLCFCCVNFFVDFDDDFVDVRRKYLVSRFFSKLQVNIFQNP